MSNSTQDFSLAVYHSVAKGEVPAARGSRGFSHEVKLVFILAEKLGKVRRGDTVFFTRREAAELHKIMEMTLYMILAGEGQTAFAKAVWHIMTLAFNAENRDRLASDLRAIKDGAAGWISDPARS